MAQGNDAALKSSLVWLAVIMVIVGICTQSWKKIMATYVVGIIGIAGLILPDWDFFDRDFSRWTCPVTAEERASILAQRQTSLLKSFTILLLEYSSYEVAARQSGIGFIPSGLLLTPQFMVLHYSSGGISCPIRSPVLPPGRSCHLMCAIMNLGVCLISWLWVAVEDRD